MPSVPRTLTSGFEHGWLTFEAGDDLRRYAPIPSDWCEMSAAALELLCSQARPATARHTPPRDPGS